ncbi:MAG TPA: hypothetical protein ENI63_00235 [Candidatus Kaiserbacteria bacterium]|nr:hypothetical protein [Candidatus Kaiserbacteria bacterium]
MYSILFALGVYLAIIAVITYYTSKKESIGEFLIAGRSLDWKEIGLSNFATLISSYNVVIGITFAYLFGIYFFLAFLGAGLAYIFLYHIAKQFKEDSKKQKFLTIVDYFAYTFGSKVSAVVNGILLFVLFFFITLQIKVNTLVFSNLLSWNIYTAGLFVTLVVLAYIYVGGFKTVVKTDIFQGVLMFAIVGLAIFVGGSGITFGNLQNNILDKAILYGALAIMVIQFLTLFAQPEIWQRIYAAKNIQNLKYGLIFSFILLILFFIPIVIIGLSARYGALITNPSNAFYEILSFASPKWFFPILAVSLFAAFMSSLDSSLFAISSQLAKNNLFKKNIPDEYTIKKHIRYWVFIVLTFALVTSFLLGDLLTSVFQLISITTIITAVFSISYILKPSKKEVLIGLLVGITVFVYTTFSGVITQEPITALYPSIVVVIFMLLQKITVLTFSKQKLNRKKQK